MADSIELRVIDVLATGDDTVPSLAMRLGAPQDAVDRAVRWGVTNGLLLRTADRFALSPQGQFVAGVRARSRQAAGPGGQVDLADVAAVLGETWAGARAGEQRALEHLHEGDLVGDEEREAVVGGLSEAYAAGRISLEELEGRSARALAATTRGELAAADADLRPAPESLVGERMVASFGRVARVRRAVATLVVLVLALAVLVRLH